ncbi:hypothetical protein [Actinacidiphila sp. ITFR-21]|uniref:hypothetical protein n=1 Tax=Actinacidiphila sp. ITFR-21 TaxID=3075199 RepID=UPI002889DF42|nr:hypothetical protein [Streptomyces sp. ITFR-21]WNI17386.1 hypothetical protein RLT57_18945 [Streptomyces sp. ITFR-21]
MAIGRLHRAKDAAYGNAWKKRGEVIGVLANLARKVDRLEALAEGAPATYDESIFDTAVDLFVYGLKYQTLLADIDPTVAATLFADPGVVPPYSDGPLGFEFLLDHVVELRADQVPSVARATAVVADTFAGVESYFSPAAAVPEPMDRLARARAVTAAAWALIAALTREAPPLYRDFITACREASRAG